MATKHTRGPWEASNGEVTTQQVEGRSFRRIAAVQDYGLGCEPEVDEANARLIAAAPELFAALQQATARLEFAIRHNDFNVKDNEAIEQARAAIAKATGNK